MTVTAGDLICGAGATTVSQHVARGPHTALGDERERMAIRGLALTPPAIALISGWLLEVL
jgi:hypothetical protein